MRHLPARLGRLAAVPLALLAHQATLAQESGAPVPAEGAAPSTSTTQRIEVTARQSATDLRRASRVAKQIYGREELDKYGDTNVLDVMRRLPGVNIGADGWVGISPAAGTTVCERCAKKSHQAARSRSAVHGAAASPVGSSTLTTGCSLIGALRLPVLERRSFSVPEQSIHRGERLDRRAARSVHQRAGRVRAAGRVAADRVAAASDHGSERAEAVDGHTGPSLWSTRSPRPRPCEVIRSRLPLRRPSRCASSSSSRSRMAERPSTTAPATVRAALLVMRPA